jgi:hypothetical protein
MHPEDTLVPMPAGDSFAAIVERFLARQGRRLKQGSYAEVKRHLQKQASALNALSIGAITRREIAEVLGKIENGSGPVARNRLRSSLSALWTWAIQDGLVEHNVVAGVFGYPGRNN